MTTVINLFGGPGCGKSTTAAGTFFMLKNLGINCEYVPEFAKDCTWEERKRALECQPYVLGEQYYRLFRLRDKVDIIVTDSPLLLSLYYGEGKNYSLDMLTMSLYDRFDNTNIFLKRTKPYSKSGRNQTEKEAKNIDGKLKSILETWSVPYLEMDGDVKAPAKIIKLIKGKICKK